MIIFLLYLIIVGWTYLGIFILKIEQKDSIYCSIIWPVYYYELIKAILR